MPKKAWQCWLLAPLALLVGLGGALMIAAWAAIGTAPSGETIELLKKSPNYRDGRFVNGLAAEEPPLFESLKEWIKGGKHTAPEQPVPVVVRSKEDLAELPQSGLRITWIGHSTTLVEVDGVRLLLDPVWSRRISPFVLIGPKRFYSPPVALDALPPIDAVLVSHDHYDHLGRDAVVSLAEMGYRFVVPLGVGARLRGWDVPASQIQELDWWEDTQVNEVQVTVTPSRHFSGRSPVMADRNATLWAGFAMVGSDHRVYYTGDTGMFPGFALIGERLGPFDATLVEVGAYHRLWADLHLGPEQAVRAVQDARGGLLIPVHWATFDLAMHSWVEPAERLIVAAANGDVPLVIPKPGQSVEPSHPLPLARWWPKLPWQSEEEHPVVSSMLASKPE